MAKIKSNNPPIPFHPIRGYATAEQFEKLQTLKDGAEYRYLKKQIEKQTKARGKI